MRALLTPAFFITSFLSAFLLFIVQPLATKAILPILGGAPSVWNTAMVCFQLLLLGGYIYAHALTRLSSPRLQWLLHGVLLALSLLQLPVTFDHLAINAAAATPMRWTLASLLLGIGLPFFCLSATAPLLQRWAAGTDTPLAQEPYRLYSVSNAGSLLALIGYIVLVEPAFDLSTQRSLWSIGYILFAALILFNGSQIRHHAEETSDSSPAPRWKDRLHWLILALIPSSMMLGVTSHLSTDIASIPLLWVIPLLIYLLSFIVAFGRHPALAMKARRHGYVLLLCLLVYATGTKISNLLILIHLVGLAVVCFAFHGMLIERRPHPAHLTQFYICMSLGGALGGLFNALAAPVIFTGTLEYPIMLVVACLMLFLRNGLKSRILTDGWEVLTILVLAVALTLVVMSLSLVASENIPLAFAIIAMALSIAAMFLTKQEERRKTLLFATVLLPLIGFPAVTYLQVRPPVELLYEKRNFFGTVRVFNNKALNANTLHYNTTLHGMQSRDKNAPIGLSAYYRNSLEEATSTLIGPDKPIGIVGLGAGTLQCLAHPNQHVDFYDINPAVLEIAETPAYFTYLRDCPGTYTNILGDGRLMMAQAPDRKYGTIIIDAFSSDAIPVHLITREALDIYRSKLAKGGVMIFHITNRYINLPPLLAAQAEAMGWKPYVKHFAEKQGPNTFETIWFVMAPTAEAVAPLLKAHSGWIEATPLPGSRPWTDNYTNMLPYFKLKDEKGITQH